MKKLLSIPNVLFSSGFTLVFSFGGALASGENSFRPLNEAEHSFDVLERREIRLPDEARSIVFKRVTPPDLPIRQSLPRQTAEKESDGDGGFRAEAHVTVFLEAAVYDREVTELRWQYGETLWTAWSNVDFSLFPAFGQIDAGDTRFTFLMIVHEESRESSGPKWIPDSSDFAPEGADYFVLSDAGSSSPPAEALFGIEALHAHFDVREESIRAAHTARQEAQSERERELRENPPVPRDTKIHFWPIQSRTHSAATNSPE